MSRRRLALMGVAALLTLAAARMTAALSLDPDGFDAGMAAATARMHAGMAVASSGDADRDFAAMMIPHHQGAVDMALLELRYGKSTVLRRLAQEIVVTQRQEIDVMQRAIAGMSRPGAGDR
jgi:uncharacterized protein (DUF305 family)